MAALNYRQYANFLNRRDVSWVFCICCALFIIGMGLTFQAPWVDWDASDYINVAENIVHGKGIVSGWESDNIHAFWPLTVWPPLYPILIACLMMIGFSSVSAAMWIPILSLAGIAVVAFFFGRDLDSPITGYLWALCSLSMSSFWEMTRWAMTEMPYIFLSLLGLYLLMRYFRSRSQWILLLSALICGAGAITRYMGVTLILTGVLILALQSWKRPVPRIKQMMLFGVISSIPVCFIFIRNLYYKGHFSGADRGSGTGTFVGIITDMMRVITSDLNPFNIFTGYAGLFAVEIFVLSLLTCIAAFLLFGVYNSDKKNIKPVILNFFHEKRIVVTYVLVYVISLLVLEIGMGDIAAIQTRYLLPVYPFLIVLGISFMHGACVRLAIPPWGIISIVVCTVLVISFLSSQAMSSIPIILDKGGKSYTDPVWYDEPVEEYQWVKQNIPPGAEIFSNNPRAMQLHLSRLVLPLPEHNNMAYAQKLLVKMPPGQMVVSLKGKKSNADYMDAEEFFSYNRNFTSPAVFKPVFSTQDAEVYQVISPAS
jgi:4-amino-4-deoxy-L-arabinose transferase-like glycosyltransferase